MMKGLSIKRLGGVSIIDPENRILKESPKSIFSHGIIGLNHRSGE